MVDAGDAHRGDGAAFKAADQNPTEGIAEGCGLAPVEGADHEHTRLGTVTGNLMVDPIDLVLQHGLWERKGGRGRSRSDAATLGPAAAVVGQGGDVADQGDLQACHLESADGRLTTGTRTAD